MKCPYCKSTLVAQEDMGPHISCCESCQRHLLFCQKICGIRFSRTGVMSLFVIQMVLAVLVFPLVMSGYLFLHLDAIVFIGMPCVILAIGIFFGYDGYLSIKTKIDNTRGSVAFGRWAVFYGLMKLGLSFFLTVIMSYGLIGSIIREVTGQWPF